MDTLGRESFDITYIKDDPDGTISEYDLDGTKLLFRLRSLASEYDVTIDPHTLAITPSTDRIERIIEALNPLRGVNGTLTDIAMWDLLWNQIANVYIRKSFHIKSFHLITDGQSVNTLSQICNRLNAIHTMHACKLNQAPLHAKWFGTIDGANSITVSNMRSWKNKLSDTPNVIICNQIDPLSIAFTLAMLTRGGHAILRINLGSNHSWLLWFTQLFEESSIVLTRIGTYICGEYFTGLSSKLRAEALEGRYVMPTPTDLTSFRERLGAIGDRLSAWKLSYVTRILREVAPSKRLADMSAKREAITPCIDISSRWVVSTRWDQGSTSTNDI